MVAPPCRRRRPAETARSAAPDDRDRQPAPRRAAATPAPQALPFRLSEGRVASSDPPPNGNSRELKAKPAVDQGPRVVVRKFLHPRRRVPEGSFGPKPRHVSICCASRDRDVKALNPSSKKL